MRDVWVPSVVQLLLLFPRVFCWVDGADTSGCGSLVGDLSGHCAGDKVGLLLGSSPARMPT